MDWAERDDPQGRAHRRGRVHRTRLAGDERRTARRSRSGQSRANHRRRVVTEDRRLEWDWFPGTVPDNVVLEDSAYVETTYSFQLYRSRVPEAVRLGRGAS